MRFRPILSELDLHNVRQSGVLVLSEYQESRGTSIVAMRRLPYQGWQGSPGQGGGNDGHAGGGQQLQRIRQQRALLRIHACGRPCSTRELRGRL